MIRFEHVTITYPEATTPTLVDVSFEVPEGELCLVVGVTGSGKSTLLRAVNGLVPRFSGGILAGSVVIDGRTTSDVAPRDLADVVGVVGQDPAAGFVTDFVEDELAYAMENLGVAPDVMRRRVEDILDLLGLHELRHRPLASLSGGQQQRVAIGSVLTAGPRVLVLDEPTSALDPAAAEEVLAALTRLVHDLGITVLIAEHRLERVVQYADRIVMVPGDGRPVVVGTPAEVFGGSVVAPPVVELGRLAGWSPLPLSVRDARRVAGPLRDQLASIDTAVFSRKVRSLGDVVATTDGLQASYGPITALRGVDLEFRAGEVVALMGRNGAGKSTLLNHLVGLREPVSGDRDAGLVHGTTRIVLDRIVPGIDASTHPRDLSEGQRLGLALSIVLASEPPLLLLDEPTRGLDYGAKQRLVEVLSQLAADGHAVVIATHDVEVVAAVADRCIVLAEGEVVADGPARDVVVHSPVFAPQVAKVLAPLALLTVNEVQLALAAASDSSYS
jgi:energy-coupling factor transport system ATP-binding protein